jgi:hypothetical protein
VGAVHRCSLNGGPPRRPGAGKVYRGSHRRLRRIKWQDNTSTELWLFVVLILIMVFVGIPWLITHPPLKRSHSSEVPALTHP